MCRAVLPIRPHRPRSPLSITGPDSMPVLMSARARHIILVAVARRIRCERRLPARVAHAGRCGGAIIIIGNGSVWRRRGAYLRRCLLLRRHRYLLLVAPSCCAIPEAACAGVALGG